MAVIWGAKNVALQLGWGVCVILLFRTFKHLNKADTKQDIYLKDVILALLWGARKLNAYKKNTSYTLPGFC